MGSVKDLTNLKIAKENEMGIGRFNFSDRYSVFDWGEMPDHIPNKGAALCIMGAYCFERCEEIGINTRFQIQEIMSLNTTDNLDSTFQ